MDLFLQHHFCIKFFSLQLFVSQIFVRLFLIAKKQTHAEINVQNFVTQKMLMQNFLSQKKRMQK